MVGMLGKYEGMECDGMKVRNEEFYILQWHE